MLEQEGILTRVHRYRENGGKTSNGYRLLHRHVTSELHKKRVSKCNNHAVREQDVIYKELEGIEHLEGVRVKEELEPSTREMSHPSHQISNLALPTTQQSSSETVLPEDYVPKSSASGNTVLEPEITQSRGLDSPRRPRSYEPRELPSSSAPRYIPDEITSENSTKRKYSIDISKMKSLAECIKHHRIAIEQKWIDSGARTRLSYFSSWAKVMRLWREERIKNPAAMMVHVIKSGLLHKYPANCDEEKALKILRELKAQEAREYWGE